MNNKVEITGILIARNTIINIFGHTFPFLIAIFAIPFVIKGLGMERFGILSLAWVILGYFAVFDLGFGSATTKFVSEAIAKDEEEKVPQLVWTAVLTQTTLGALGALILFLLIPIFVDKIFNIPFELRDEAKETFYLVCLFIPVGFVSNSFFGLMAAVQRFDLVNVLRIPSAISIHVLSIIGVFLTYQLSSIIALILGFRLLILLVQIVLSIHIFPTLLQFSISKNLFRKMSTFGVWLTVSNSINPLIFYIDRFMIGSILTMSAVTYYTAPFELSARLWVISTSMVMTLIPAFSTLDANRKREDIQRIFTRSIKYLFIISGALVFIVTAFSDEILQYWLGFDFVDKCNAVFQILLISILLDYSSSISCSFLEGTGRSHILAKVKLIYLPIHLILTGLFVKTMGIFGAGLSMLIIRLTYTVIFSAFSLKVMELPIKSFIKDLWTTIASLFAFGILIMATSYLNLLFQVFTVIILICLFGTMVWFYILDDAEKRVFSSKRLFMMVAPPLKRRLRL